MSTQTAPEIKTPLPEIEVRVSKAWIRMIRYCQTEAPHCDIEIRIVDAQPTVLLKVKKRVRFDKESTIPVNFGDEV